MLIGIFGRLFVSSARNIEQAIDTRLHGISSLIAKLKRLFCERGIFVDHFIDQVLDRRDILRCAELVPLATDCDMKLHIRYLTDIIEHARSRTSESLVDWIDGRNKLL